METNVLIAEFMGATIIGSGERKLIAFPDKRITDEDGNYMGMISNNRSVKDLHYDTDWNWLMEVVSLIKERQILGSQNLIDDIDNALTCDGQIGDVYSTVINFIVRFNGKIKEYDYKCTSNSIWSSFDFGTVLAVDLGEATKKAKDELRMNLEKCNDALKHCDITNGFSVTMDLDLIEVTRK